VEQAADVIARAADIINRGFIDMSSWCRPANGGRILRTFFTQVGVIFAPPKAFTAGRVGA
jgi:hypothetical protein